MEMRRERAGNLPAKAGNGRAPSRWEPQMEELRTTPVGDFVVVEFREGDKAHLGLGVLIQRLARTRKLKCKAYWRGKELWIERLA